MNRRNFSLALTATVFAVVVLARRRFRQIATQFFYPNMGVRQTRARFNETQERMDAAKEDLRGIVQAEIGHIRKWGKFATLDELVSSGDLGSEMAGRHGYVYSIQLEGKEIIATAYPAPGEQLPAIVNIISGPGLAPVLANLQKEI